MIFSQDYLSPYLVILGVNACRNEGPAHCPPTAFLLPYRVQASHIHEARTLTRQGAF